MAKPEPTERAISENARMAAGRAGTAGHDPETEGHLPERPGPDPGGGQGQTEAGY